MRKNWVGREALRDMSFVAGNQSAPKARAKSAGDFVVAWNSAGQDGSGSGVVARRYFASGAPATGEILANTDVAGDQTLGDLSIESDGSFTVTWLGRAPDDSPTATLETFSPDGQRRP